jgi:predicted alpha/beta superfamily hydrolase
MLMLCAVCAVSLLADSVRVSFKVEAPMPDSLPVRVVGSPAVLGAWSEVDALVLARQGSGLWGGAIRVPTGAGFAFNLVRGGWDAEAVLSTGAPRPDEWCVAGSDTTISIVVEGWEDTSRPSGRIAGHLVSLGKLPSSLLPEPRDVWVILPRSYPSDSTARYPVLYVHDGQDSFDATRSTTGAEWRLDETADSLTLAGIIPGIIIVAVAATQYRTHEYADTTLGEAYAEFLVEELKPLVDGRFRTMTGREHTATIGRSLGGLISLLAAWWHPFTFGQAACLSPFLLWGDGKVFGTLDAVPPVRPRLFFSIGGEPLDSMLAPSVEASCSLFARSKWRPGHDLRCSGPPEGDRSDSSQSAVLVEALEFLFSGRGRETGSEPHGVEDGISKVPY